MKVVCGKTNKRKWLAETSKTERYNIPVCIWTPTRKLPTTKSAVCKRAIQHPAMLCAIGSILFVFDTRSSKYSHCTVRFSTLQQFKTTTDHVHTYFGRFRTKDGAEDEYSGQQTHVGHRCRPRQATMATDWTEPEEEIFVKRDGSLPWTVGRTGAVSSLVQQFKTQSKRSPPSKHLSVYLAMIAKIDHSELLHTEQWLLFHSVSLTSVAVCACDWDWLSAVVTGNEQHCHRSRKRTWNESNCT